MLWQAFGRWGGLGGTSASGGSSSDTYWSSVKLLLGFNGANGSTTFTDESSAAHGNATVSGNAQVTTTNPKFGTGAGLFDGVGDILYYGTQTDWHLGGDFTLEGWYLFDASAIETLQVPICRWETTLSKRSWILQYRGDLATNALQFVGSDTGSGTTTLATYNWTPTADTWYHIAVDRSGNVFRLYINGSMVATTTTAITIFNSGADLRLGCQFAGGTDADFFKGKMDEVRLTKGVARYASDSGYTVPTAAFPRS